MNKEWFHEIESITISPNLSFDKQNFIASLKLNVVESFLCSSFRGPTMAVPTSMLWAR